MRQIAAESSSSETFIIWRRQALRFSQDGLLRGFVSKMLFIIVWALSMFPIARCPCRVVGLFLVVLPEFVRRLPEALAFPNLPLDQLAAAEWHSNRHIKWRQPASQVHCMCTCTIVVVVLLRVATLEVCFSDALQNFCLARYRQYWLPGKGIATDLGCDMLGLLYCHVCRNAFACCRISIKQETRTHCIRAASGSICLPRLPHTLNALRDHRQRRCRPEYMSGSRHLRAEGSAGSAGNVNCAPVLYYTIHSRTPPARSTLSAGRHGYTCRGTVLGQGTVHALPAVQPHPAVINTGRTTRPLERSLRFASEHVHVVRTREPRGG